MKVDEILKKTYKNLHKINSSLQRREKYKIIYQENKILSQNNLYIEKSLSDFFLRFFFFFFISSRNETILYFRLGVEPRGTTRDQVIYAKKLYESAFHPDTGELQNVFGRMSFQVPGGMAITGAMLQFYR